MSENSNSTQNFLYRFITILKKVFFWIGRFVKKHKFFTLTMVLIIIALVFGIRIYGKINAKKNLSVDNSLITTPLSKMDLTSSISVTGTIASADEKSVSTTLNGTEIKEVHVSVGDHVNKGDVIITFDSSDLEEELETAENNAALNNLKNQKNLMDAAEAVTDAKENYDTQAAGLLEDVNVALSNYNNLAAKRDEALTNYQKAQSEVQTAQDHYDTVRAQWESEGWAVKVSEAKSALDAAQAEYDRAAAVTDVDLTGSIYDKLQNAKAEYDNAVARYETPLKDAESALESAKQAENQTLASYEEYSSQADAAYGAYYGKVNTQTSTNEKNEDQIEDSEYNYKITSLEQSNNQKTQNNQIQEVEEKLGRTVVTSPISGVITAVNVEAGDTYNGETLFVVQDMEHFIVEAAVDEYDISNINKDLKAVVKTDATGDDELNGTVTFVAPTPDSTSGSDTNGGGNTTNTSPTYTIQITLEDYDERLRIGMTAKTAIILDSREDVFAVAYDCVQIDEEGNSYIEVTDKASVSQNSRDFEKNISENRQNTRRIYVECGMESDYYVEIISDQLYEGMQVVASVSSSNNLLDNMENGENQIIYETVGPGGNPGGSDMTGGPGGAGPSQGSFGGGF